MATKIESTDKNISLFQTREEDIVTILKNLDAKVDAIQRSQATLRPDIIEQIMDILKRRWKDDTARRRERCW